MCGRAPPRWLRRALRLPVRRRVLPRSLSARVHGSRTHHGTFYAPSTVLKTEGLTGAPALSCEFSSELAVRVYVEGRRGPLPVVSSNVADHACGAQFVIPRPGCSVMRLPWAQLALRRAARGQGRRAEGRERRRTP